jgi:ABC-type multidrug transport system fused ATPase/permease subunit
MKKMLALRRGAMVWTDKRAKLIQELLGGMRIIKFFAWEIPYLDRINQIRRQELKKIRSLLITRAITMAVATSLPVLATVIAFSAYAYTVNDNRDPATIFTSLTLFNLLRMPLMLLPVALATATDARNAFDRLREVFLAERISRTYEIDINAKNAVQVTNGTFMWESEPPKEEGSKKEKKEAAKKAVKERKAGQTPSAHKKESKMPWKKTGSIAAQDQSADQSHDKEALIGDVTDVAVPVPAPGTDESTAARPGSGTATPKEPQIKDISFSIPRGQLCAIVGPVGSGKSSLLSAMIGEMKILGGNVTFGGRVGYCPQQAWIQNATVKNNILFGQPYDEARYQKAIFDSCLTSDLDMLPHGDMTEIGEKGITLSGGQKQRVNIARALYFNADVTLFDDPLSAVDSHVGQHLFTHALQGALAGRTRVLVTHALHFLPQVDHIITVSEGKIVEQGTYNELLARHGAFADLVAEFGNDEEETKRMEEAKEKQATDGKPNEKQQLKKKEEDGPKKAHKLMQEEERATGAVGLKVYKQYLGAARPYMAVLVLLSLVLMQAATVINSYVLVWWQEK